MNLLSFNSMFTSSPGVSRVRLHVIILVFLNRVCLGYIIEYGAILIKSETEIKIMIVIAAMVRFRAQDRLLWVLYLIANIYRLPDKTVDGGVGVFII